MLGSQLGSGSSGLEAARVRYSPGLDGMLLKVLKVERNVGRAISPKRMRRVKQAPTAIVRYAASREASVGPDAKRLPGRNMRPCVDKELSTHPMITLPRCTGHAITDPMGACPAAWWSLL